MATGAPQVPPVVGQGVIDTHVLGRPRGYNGTRSGWPQFNYVLKAYIREISSYLLRMMDAVESQTVPVPMSGMTIADGAARVQAARVHSGAGAQRHQPPNGHDRGSVQRHGELALDRQGEEPTAGTSQVQQLTALLQPRFSGRREPFESELHSFEGLVQAYERTHSGVRGCFTSGSAKAQLASRGTGQVEMQSFASARRLREPLSAYVANQQVLHPWRPTTTTDGNRSGDGLEKDIKAARA